ncbi:MAG: YraN family protein [Patescibacteria group bacterium]
MFEKKKTGNKGEDIACKILIEKGYKILDRNYSKKCGEIDIVAEKDKQICFVEVKTETVDLKQLESLSLINRPRPEEKVNAGKLRRISKTIQVYLWSKHKEDSDWNFLVISILFDPIKKVARVKIIEDVVPE